MPPFLEDWADELGMSPWYDDESADELPDAPADITLSPEKVSPNRLEGSFLGHRPSSQPRPVGVALWSLLLAQGCILTSIF